MKYNFSVPLSADLFVPDPLSCIQYEPKFVCTLKIPYPSVIKRVGITAGAMETPKHCSVCTQEKKKKLGSAILWLLAFPWGKQPAFHVHCTGTRKLYNLI